MTTKASILILAEDRALADVAADLLPAWGITVVSICRNLTQALHHHNNYRTDGLLVLLSAPPRQRQSQLRLVEGWTSATRLPVLLADTQANAPQPTLPSPGCQYTTLAALDHELLNRVFPASAGPTPLPEALHDQYDCGLVVLDSAYKLCYINRVATELMRGPAPEPMVKVGLPLLDLLPPAVAQLLVETLEPVWERGAMLNQQICHVKVVDRQEAPYIFDAQPLGPDKVVVQFRLHKPAVHGSQQQLQLQGFMHSTVPLAWIDNQGGIRQYNTAFAQLLHQVAEPTQLRALPQDIFLPLLQRMALRPDQPVSLALETPRQSERHQVLQAEIMPQPAPPLPHDMAAPQLYLLQLTVQEPRAPAPAPPAVHFAPFGYIVVSHHGQLVYANKQSEAMMADYFGMVPDHGTNLAELMPTPGLQQRMYKLLAHARHEAFEVMDNDLGQPLRVNFMPQPDGQHISVLMLDATTEENLAQQLRHAEAALRGLLAAVKYPAFVCQPNGTIHHTNAAAATRLKKAETRLPGLLLPELLAKNKATRPLAAALQTLLQQQDLQPLRQTIAQLAETPDEDRTEELVYYKLPENQGFVLVVADLTPQKQLAVAQRRAESLRLRTEFETLEAERSRMAREIHDGIAQWAAAARLHTEGLRQMLLNTGSLSATETTQLEGPLDALTDALAHLQEELRHITVSVQPAALERNGLVGALQHLATNFQQANPHMQLFLQMPRTLPGLNEAAQTALYRIVQECLHNAARHAKATELRLQLTVMRRHVVLMIEDNGMGFAPQGPELQMVEAASPACIMGAGKIGGRGLHNMRQRAQAVGAELEIDSRPGLGTSLIIRVPYN